MSRWPRWWGSIIGNYAERLADLHCLIRHLLLQDLGSQIVFDRAASRRRAEELVNLGMGAADAAHVALAEQAGCDFVTMGQYLSPSPAHLPIRRYLSPEEFDELGAAAKDLGFRYVESGPLVRSSYHAAKPSQK